MWDHVKGLIWNKKNIPNYFSKTHKIAQPPNNFKKSWMPKCLRFFVKDGPLFLWHFHGFWKSTEKNVPMKRTQMESHVLEKLPPGKGITFKQYPFGMRIWDLFPGWYHRSISTSRSFIRHVCKQWIHDLKTGWLLAGNATSTGNDIQKKTWTISFNFPKSNMKLKKCDSCKSGVVGFSSKKHFLVNFSVSCFGVGGWL